MTENKVDKTVVFIITVVILGCIILGSIKYHMDKIDEDAIETLMDSVYIHGYEDALKQNGYD